MASEAVFAPPARGRQAPIMSRTIIHVDMDAFYASIEQRDDPSLARKPVIVGGVSGKRGVVSAASYEARRFGVHSAMPVSRARRLCPDGAFISGNMKKYVAVSKELRGILSSYTPLVEPLSLDEAFLDVTASLRLWGSSEQIGREIKARVRDELDLTASVGIAPNKFLAKMASDHGKPDGLVVIKPGEETEFLRDLPVRQIFGVGKVTARRMTERGIRRIGQLAEMTRQELRRAFGKQGERLYEPARRARHRRERGRRRDRGEIDQPRDDVRRRHRRRKRAAQDARRSVRPRQRQAQARGAGRLDRGRKGAPGGFHDAHEGAIAQRAGRRRQRDLLDRMETV